MTLDRVCVDCGAEVARTSRRCRSCAGKANAARQHVSRDGTGRRHCARCGMDRPLAGRCPGCRQVDGATLPTFCALDGAPIKGHPRCQACSALTGERHAQQMTPRGVCGPCLAAIARMAKREGWRAA